MIANGTILGVAPMWKTMMAAGGVLALLFTFMEPEVSLALDVFPRLLFWILHISCGVGGILLASYLIRLFSIEQMPVFIAITITGIIGAILSAPCYLLLDSFYPDSPPDGWLDVFEAQGWWQALLAEFLEVLPVFLASWYIVNLPLFFNTTQLNSSLPPDDPDDPKDIEGADSQAHRQKIRGQLYERLPKVIGEEIVAISSDLHYLNVHTVLGKTLLLGSLKEYVRAFGETGMQIHRSHWVSKEHVVKVHITGKAAYCLMSNGLKIPVSRSKRNGVKRYFGQSALTVGKNPRNRLVRVK